MAAATTALGTSTPSPRSPSSIHTPPTPRFGYGDSYEPYTPRKSARLSARRAADRTPSPKQPPAPNSHKSQHQSSMTPPATSPRKKRVPPTTDSSRRVSGSLTKQGIRNAAHALGQPDPTMDAQSPRPVRKGTVTGSVLPTPAKTPARKHSKQKQSQIDSVARTLFAAERATTPPHVEPARPSKKRKAASADESFEIYTDSNARVPEVDTSADNPFYGESTSPAASRRSLRISKVQIPGEGPLATDKAAQRQDGTVYMFRGKAIWRKAKTDDDLNPDDQDEVEAEVENEVGHRPSRNLRPRLLFPPKGRGAETPKPSQEDEEAETDIEDHVLASSSDPVVTTSSSDKAATSSSGQAAYSSATERSPTPPMAAATPSAPKYASVSRFRFTYATPTADKTADLSTTSKKSVSPFDNWPRVKSGGRDGRKRRGDVLTDEAAPKRQRT